MSRMLSFAVRLAAVAAVAAQVSTAAAADVQRFRVIRPDDHGAPVLQPIQSMPKELDAARTVLVAPFA